MPGNVASLAAVDNNPLHRFLQADICNRAGMQEAFDSFKPERVMHLAAESRYHIDNPLPKA